MTSRSGRFGSRGGRRSTTFTRRSRAFGATRRTGVNHGYLSGGGSAFFCSLRIGGEGLSRSFGGSRTKTSTRRLSGGGRRSVVRISGGGSAGYGRFCSSRGTTATRCCLRFGRGGGFRRGGYAYTRFRTLTATFWTTLLQSEG